jgi:hypothetical protein
MPLITKVKSCQLTGVCQAEDAEVLLAWLLTNRKGTINLKDCSHLHSAILQVLLVFKPTISVWPLSGQLATLLQAAGLAGAR